MRYTQNKIWLVLGLIILIAGITFIIIKNKQKQVVANNSELIQGLNEFKQQLKELGLKDSEIDELIELDDKFVQANNEFDAQQEELFKKYPEQLEQFVMAVSNAMVDYRFDDQDPAIKALAKEPVIAKFITAWKNIHTKERELEEKYPALREFLLHQQEEILQEAAAKIEQQENKE